MAERKTQKQEHTTKVRKPWQSGQYTVYLWEFLYGLLQDPECCSLITWTSKETKEFRINNVHEIAQLWGTIKNRPTMDDKKLLRALRYYYKTKILRKVKGHKGVYQFLSIPYETEGCEQKVNKNSSGKESSTPPLVGSPQHDATDFSKKTTTDCSERLADNHKIRVDDHELTVHERERIRDSREQTEENMDECNGYRSRDESSSESSLSSDSSTSKSLDEIQADLLDHMNMTENIDFVFSDDFNMGLSHSEDMLDW